MTSFNAQARRQALNSLPPLLASQSGSLTYTSKGHLLIIGPEDQARLIADQLSGLSSTTLLIQGQVTSQETEHLEKALAAAPQAKVIYAAPTKLQGWLGHFSLEVSEGEQQPAFNPAPALIGQDHFDLVLDLSPSPLLSSELAPPGYFSVSPDTNALSEVVPEISGLKGEFEKPSYLEVNHDLCAHADRGQAGCTRCLDVCPADAIRSHKNTPTHDFIIEVEDALCHGAGSCTTACPTGALSFVSPQPGSRLTQLRQLLDSYRDAGGEHPALLITEEASTPETETLPGHLLPLVLEESAGVGMEIWFSLLAAGCTFVAIETSAQTPPTLVKLLEREVRIAGELLQTLGHPAARISLLQADQRASQLQALDDQLEPWRNQPPSDPFEWQGKRSTLNAALERLFEQVEAEPEPRALPASAPFGQVLVNTEACTLCMSCVALCPTGALRGGDAEAPRLAFLESDCVQCGLCQAGCPEQVIQLEPRFVAAPGIRQVERTLKQEDPFHCISCGQAFGSRSTIEHIMHKLEGHSYFQGSAARRLQMCEDCRVRDSYRELAADPEAQLRL